MKQRALVLLAIPITSAACSSNWQGVDTASYILPFCESMDDSDTYLIETGGGSGASGVVIGRLVTDESDDIHDPNFVADVEYTLENIDVGGTQQQGETDDSGYFKEILGEGNWLLKLSAFKASLDCLNEISFNVEAGNTTDLCIDVHCE